MWTKFSRFFASRHTHIDTYIKIGSCFIRVSFLDNELKQIFLVLHVSIFDISIYYIYEFIRRMLLTFAKRPKMLASPGIDCGLIFSWFAVWYIGIIFYGTFSISAKATTHSDDFDRLKWRRLYFYFFIVIFFFFREHQQTTVEKHKIILRQSNQFGWLYGVICRENRFIRLSIVYPPHSSSVRSFHGYWCGHSTFRFCRGKE